jgi:hypothetical protein
MQVAMPLKSLKMKLSFGACMRSSGSAKPISTVGTEARAAKCRVRGWCPRAKQHQPHRNLAEGKGCRADCRVTRVDQRGLT